MPRFCCLRVGNQLPDVQSRPLDFLAVQSFGPADVALAKRRLAALLADPAMGLSDLAAEVARLAGGEQSAARERAMQDSIHRMLSRTSGAMKVGTGGPSMRDQAPRLLSTMVAAGPNTCPAVCRPCLTGCHTVLDCRH